MRFFYANGDNQPTGPVDQAELQRLRTAGAIADTTPVIREGEASWGTYADHAPAAVAVALPPLPPVYAPPTPPAVPATPAVTAPSVSRAVDPTEEMVRQKVAAGAAVAGATARVIGKTALATARGTARALGDLAQQADAAQAGAAARVSAPAGSRGLVTAGFAMAWVSMIVLPVLRMSMKGEVQSVRMLGLISNKGDTNLAAVLALLLPIVGIAVTWAMRGRWRMPSAAVALLGALTTYMAVSSGHDMVRRASMGMAESSTGVGLWVAVLALLAVAGLSFAGARGSAAGGAS